MSIGGAIISLNRAEIPYCTLESVSYVKLGLKAYVPRIQFIGAAVERFCRMPLVH